MMDAEAVLAATANCVILLTPNLLLQMKCILPLRLLKKKKKSFFHNVSCCIMPSLKWFYLIKTVAIEIPFLSLSLCCICLSLFLSNCSAEVSLSLILSFFFFFYKCNNHFSDNRSHKMIAILVYISCFFFLSANTAVFNCLATQLQQCNREDFSAFCLLLPFPF